MKLYNKSGFKKSPSNELRKMELLFKRGSVSVQFTKTDSSCFGDIVFVIRVDHTKGDFIDTFLHEMFHALYPQENNNRINCRTKRFIAHSSWETKKKVIQLMMKCKSTIVE